MLEEYLEMIRLGLSEKYTIGVVDKFMTQIQEVAIDNFHDYGDPTLTVSQFNKIYNSIIGVNLLSIEGFGTVDISDKVSGVALKTLIHKYSYN